MNPNFINTIDFVPATRLDYGTNLGTEWQTGLSTTATWSAGSSPGTSNQNGIWQVGARIYSVETIYISQIVVTSADGTNSISTDNGTLLLNADILPSNASSKAITWSITNGTGQATISSSGVVTAIANGTVTARATATDGSGVSGTVMINISGQFIPVTGITVTGAGGASIITNNEGTLQLNADILPLNSTNQSVNWSILNITGDAIISSTGLVTALSNGTVTARATAADGSGIYGALDITISGQIITVQNITVTGENGINSIKERNGSLQLNASIFPSNATQKSVTWSMVTGVDLASINSTGLVTAVDNGLVTAQATANDGSGVFGTMDISIDLSKQKPYSVITTPIEIKIIFNEDFVSWIADLYNLKGNLIMRKIVEANSVVFDTSHMASGLYIIVLSKGDLLIVEKIMVS
jgi:uncharacterized protein YjdB